MKIKNKMLRSIVEQLDCFRIGDEDFTWINQLESTPSHIKIRNLDRIVELARITSEVYDMNNYNSICSSLDRCGVLSFEQIIKKNKKLSFTSLILIVEVLRDLGVVSLVESDNSSVTESHIKLEHGTINAYEEILK